MPSSARRYKPPRPPGQRVAAAQPLAALPPYGCGVPLAGKAERAEGGTSGTLVTEILGAPQREDSKREANQMRPCTPTRSGTIRHGTIDIRIEDNSVPEGQAKSALAPIRRPPSRAEGHCTGARLAPFSFGPCNRAAVGGSAAYGCGIPLAGTARFLFGQDRKENGGGASPLDKPPGGSQTTVAAVRRPKSSPGG